MEKKNRLLRGIGFLFEGKNTSKIDDDNFCTTLLSILESIQLYTFFFFFFFGLTHNLWKFLGPGIKPKPQQ